LRVVTVDDVVAQSPTLSASGLAEPQRPPVRRAREFEPGLSGEAAALPPAVTDRNGELADPGFANHSVSNEPLEGGVVLLKEYGTR
jgi:hypothetical protein